MRAAGTVALVCTMAGCADPTGPTAETQLQGAVAQWNQLGLTSYDLEIQRLCYCGLAGRIRIEVRAGRLDAAHLVEQDLPIPPALLHNLPTVEGLFAIIQQAIDRPASRLRVRYDPATGAPITIIIDYDRRAIDDELSITVLSIEPRDG